MPKDDPLYLRMYRDPLLIGLTRAIGHLGFRARELAGQLEDLVRQHGAQNLSLALREIATFDGGRVMLNPKAKKIAWQLLGPPPERWPEIYKDTATRPENWDKPPEIPKGEPDPLMDELYTLSASMLEDRLKKSRWLADRSEKGGRTEAVAIASEMLRRGMEVPPEEEKRPEAKPKKRVKKKAG